MLMHLQFDALSFDEIFHARNFQSARGAHWAAGRNCLRRVPGERPPALPSCLGQLCPSQLCLTSPAMSQISDAKVRPPWAEAPI